MAFSSSSNPDPFRVSLDDLAAEWFSHDELNLQEQIGNAYPVPTGSNKEAAPSAEVEHLSNPVEDVEVINIRVLRGKVHYSIRGTTSRAKVISLISIAVTVASASIEELLKLTGALLKLIR